MARNLILLVAIIAAGIFAISSKGENAREFIQVQCIGSAKIRRPGNIQTLMVNLQYVSDLPVEEDSTPTPAPAEAVIQATPSTNVVSAITGNRWTSDTLIVSGTLTNTSTVVVLITGIDSKGFNQDQKMVVEGSAYTIVHNDLAPGQTVNFKVALKDGEKQVKFVKVTPSWSP
jgi:hypothetical protein